MKKPSSNLGGLSYFLSIRFLKSLSSEINFHLDVRMQSTMDR